VEGGRDVRAKWERLPVSSTGNELDRTSDHGKEGTFDSW